MRPQERVLVRARVKRHFGVARRSDEQVFEYHVIILLPATWRDYSDMACTRPLNRSNLGSRNTAAT